MVQRGEKQGKKWNIVNVEQGQKLRAYMEELQQYQAFGNNQCDMDASQSHNNITNTCVWEQTQNRVSK